MAPYGIMKMQEGNKIFQSNGYIRKYKYRPFKMIKIMCTIYLAEDEII